MQTCISGRVSTQSSQSPTRQECYVNVCDICRFFSPEQLAFVSVARGLVDEQALCLDSLPGTCSRGQTATKSHKVLHILLQISPGEHSWSLPQFSVQIVQLSGNQVMPTQHFCGESFQHVSILWRCLLDPPAPRLWGNTDAPALSLADTPTHSARCRHHGSRYTGDGHTQLYDRRITQRIKNTMVSINKNKMSALVCIIIYLLLDCWADSLLPAPSSPPSDASISPLAPSLLSSDDISTSPHTRRDFVPL